MAASSSTTSTRIRSFCVTSSAPVICPFPSVRGGTTCSSPRAGDLLVLLAGSTQVLHQAPDVLGRRNALPQILGRVVRPVPQLVAEAFRIRVAKLRRHFLEP